MPLSRPVRAVLLAGAALVVSSCSSSNHQALTAPTSSTEASTTTASVPTSATTASPATSTAGFSAISGTYVAGTSDGGWVYLRSDGAGRFRSPDSVACPTCSTAGAPIASLDFSLTSIAGGNGSNYTAQGKVTATSDPGWAAKLAAPTSVGSPVSLSVDPGGHLTLNLLPGNDVLKFASHNALYSNVSPCTVQAVTAPIQTANPGQQDTVSGVKCSTDGEWASASVSVKSGSSGFDEVVVLAGNGTTWVVVNRPAVCNGHDVTPAFYQTACGTS